MVLILNGGVYLHRKADDWKGSVRVTQADDIALLQALGLSTIDMIIKRGAEQRDVPAEGGSFARDEGTHGQRTPESNLPQDEGVQTKSSH